MRRKIRLYLCKILQRRVYDLFSNKQSLILCFAFFCMAFIASLHIFEIFLIRSHKTESIKAREECNSCMDFPIDAVYTWVNGSDPTLIQQLLQTKQQIQNTFHSNQFRIENYECIQNKSTFECNDNCIETPIVFMTPPVINSNEMFDGMPKLSVLDSQGTLIYFSNITEANEITLKCFLSYNTTTYSVRKTHIILGQRADQPNDRNGNKNHKNSEIVVNVSSLLLMHGIPENRSSDSELLRYLSPFARKQVNVINIYDNKSIVLFSIKNPIVNVTKVIQSLRMAFLKTQTNNQSIKFEHPVQLAIDGTDSSLTDSLSDTLKDISESRFADNQELKYSLRSLETNANWIRNIYIVTNGQIPNWLNLDNPRIKVIAHEEIFTNKSHLPSFSSPAIETHLHRIPNLSKRFIYLNDDILFGRPIYPDDFYTKSKGFKVRLSWPVPNCADGCPLNWLKDGYCDQACNSSECLWDGGDCDSNKTNIQKQTSNTYSDSPLRAKYNDGYCSVNCVNSWLSDRFCDQVCNNIECGFDLGDCGTNNLNLIQNFQFTKKRRIYIYSNQTNAIYFNFTKFLDSYKNLELNEISYENNTFIRSSVMNMNHKILIFLFYSNQEKENLNITLKGLRNNSDFIIRFQALVSNDSKLNTSYASIDENFSEEEEEIEVKGNDLTETYLYKNIGNQTSDERMKIESKFLNRYPEYPKILPLNETQFNISFECEFNINELPNEIKEKFFNLEMKLKKGILTNKGYENFKQRLIQLYVNQLCDYEKTIKGFDQTISAFDWEKQSTFKAIENSIERRSVEKTTVRSDERVLRRHLMDSYADSLRHVNHLYNQVFGIQMRKVPAHMAHFIDVDIMSRLQNTFSHHFDITSSHRIRSSDDMQFAFAYNYYLMSELKTPNISQLFNEFDVDSSGTWSVNEIRTAIINTNELPLKLENFKEFYENIFSCFYDTNSSLCLEMESNANISQYYYNREQYIGSEQSIEIPESVVLNCENLTNKLNKLLETEKRNRFEILDEEEVSFKMIRSNATIVGKELDELNKYRKKFLCLNDNIEHKADIEEVIQIKQMLVQFYESMFPKRSQFELPFGQTNRFAYIQEYKQWVDKQNINSDYKPNILWISLTIFALILVFILKKIDLTSRELRILVKPSSIKQRYYREV